MDKRIKYMIVLDTETAPLDRELQKVDPYNMFVYDMGWAVVDKRGNVYRTQSFVNADIFLDEKDLMRSAYYADKLPQYWADIKCGRRILTSFYNIRKALLEDIETFGVTEVYAHNMRFDWCSLTNTQRWLTKSKYRYFFPYELEICDTLKMARDVIGKMPSYRRFCENNNYMTKNHQLRFTAEVLYRFISGNEVFEEEHTGLADVMIEKEILAYCYKQHKTMRRKMWN